MQLSIRPGSSEIIKEAREVFGTERVIISTEFRAPVVLIDLSEDETITAKEYFESLGKKVEVKEEAIA